MPSVPTDLAVRRRLVDGFPYAVVYRIVTNGIIETVAVMHGNPTRDESAQLRPRRIADPPVSLTLPPPRPLHSESSTPPSVGSSLVTASQPSLLAPPPHP